MNNLPLLIETIRIQTGRVRHIEYHNQRCNTSRKTLFGLKDKIDLRQYIDTAQAMSDETKCRITYDEKIKKVEYLTYSMKPIHSLALIEVGDLDYTHKYADRTKLEEIFDQKGDNDDILMTRNGLLTDTYYCNVSLLKEGKWYTPKSPLLQGTTRARLIKKGKIIPMDIHKDEMQEFSQLSIFNAMIPFKKLIIPL